MILVRLIDCHIAVVVHLTMIRHNHNYVTKQIVKEGHGHETKLATLTLAMVCCQEARKPSQYCKLHCDSWFECCHVCCHILFYMYRVGQKTALFLLQQLCLLSADFDNFWQRQ